MREGERVLFGTAGNSESFYAEGHKRSVDTPVWLAARGLDWFEYSCGNGISISEATSRAIGEAARQAGIGISVHAPYFINFCNPDPEKRARSRDYIARAVQVAAWMGGRRVIFHPGSVMKQSRADALACALGEMELLVQENEDVREGRVMLCPETMGKLGQLGSLEEVLRLCAVSTRLTPCLDFGHLYCRMQGGIRGREDYARILDRLQEALPDCRAENFHAHFSHILYGKMGEIRHLTFRDGDAGPDFAPLAAELAARGLTPVVVCESAGTQAEDAMVMRDQYRAAAWHKVP